MAMASVIVYIVTSAVLLVALSSAYVDIKSATIYRDDNDESNSFGQVVEQINNWLLIGEPLDTSKRGLGSLSVCKPGKQSSCKKMPYHREAVYWDFRLVDEDTKSDITSTEQSALNNQPQMTCIASSLLSEDFKLHQGDVGICWVTSTCRSSTNEKGKVITPQSLCVDGFSAALLKRSQRQMLMVNHGNWYGQYPALKVTKDKRGNVRATISTDGSPMGVPDTYIGLSSTVVDYDGDGEKDYLVGVPLGNDGAGRIEIYSKNLTLIGTIESCKEGTNFGKALAATDLNGDRYEDIVVGALDEKNNGIVHIFYYDEDKGYTCSNHEVLETGVHGVGDEGHGQFGYVVRGVGDIDGNGFNDVCVGIPDAGGNNGTVVFYFRSANGAVAKAIHGSDFDPSLVSFGQAISMGMDQDGNSRPHVLIGARGAAVYLRTRPVVSDMHLSMQLTPKRIYQGAQDCGGVDDESRMCFRINICAVHYGAGGSTLPFTLRIAVDPTMQRAFFSKTNATKTKIKIKLPKGKNRCISRMAYFVEESMYDIRPIDVTASIRLSKGKNTESSSKKLVPFMLPKEISDSVLVHDCGLDDVCIPNLNVHGALTYPDDETSELEMMVYIKNAGEAASSVNLDIGLPDGVYLRYAINTDVTFQGRQHVSCYIRQIAEEEEVELSLRFGMEEDECNITCTQTFSVFNLSVNSTIPETSDNLNDNSYAIPFDYSSFFPKTTTTDSNVNSSFFPKTTTADSTTFDLHELNVSGTVNSTMSTSSNSRSSNFTNASDYFRFYGRVKPDQIDDRYNGTMSHVVGLKYIGNETFGNDLLIVIVWPAEDEEGRQVMLIRETNPLVTTNGQCNASTLPDCISSPYITAHTSADDKIKIIKNARKHCSLVQCLMSDITPGKDFTVTIVSSFDAEGYLMRRRETANDTDIHTFDFVLEASIYPFGLENAPLRMSLVTKLHRTSVGRITSSAMRIVAGIWTSVLLLTYMSLMLL